jgi:hypothetical protein
MISVRGMMTAGALFVWQILIIFLSSRFYRNAQAISDTRTGVEQKTKQKTISSRILEGLPFVPGFTFALWFLWWHKEATGWSGFHPNSPWAPTFKPAEGLELFRNLLVLGWRWLDFGRVFEWLALSWLIWRAWPAKKINPATIELLVLLICLIIFLSPTAVLFKNVSAHRYFLPGFLALHLLVFQIFASQKVYLSNPSLFLKILILSLGAGNLWVYPRGVAMGWDATLAHLPYHGLRARAISYLESEKIDFQTVGSFFPNLNTGENVMLNGDNRRFADKDFARNKYMFVSNVFNDISGTEYLLLQNEWSKLKEWQQAGVWVAIYRQRQ